MTEPGRNEVTALSEGDRLREENRMLRARLSGLTDAILRISEDLDLDIVLQEIVDSARSLTDARCGAITTLDESGELQEVLVSATTPEEKQALMDLSEKWSLFRYLTGFEETFRTGNLAAHAESIGFPQGHLPARAFVGTPIRDGDKHIGNIYIGDKESGQEFTNEDEETLEMFAAQAAMAITNARRYGDEQRAKADLEALVNTSQVGVLVFDAKSGLVVKFNQEARRNPRRHLRRGLSLRGSPQVDDVSADGWEHHLS